jgi:hypothetical protein
LPQLFFIKRRPKPHIPRDWHKPKEGKAYDELLHREGFITNRFWDADNLEMSPTIRQDLADLDEHLLPAFWYFNQKAQHYQNRFYLYQWIFMTGAFMTTVLGATTTYLYGVYPDGATVSTLSGVATATMAGFITFFNVLYEQGKPQTRWANTRRLTEELRTTYFKYLGHIAPFDTPDRLQLMRQIVIAIRRKENQNG